MSIPNQVPESSMEEILASIRKIISEEESKGSDTPSASSPPASRPDLRSDNVSPLFVERRGATRPSDRSGVPTAASLKQPSAPVPAEVRPTAASEALAEGDVLSRSRPLGSGDRKSERRLLSPGAEAAVTKSFAELRAAATSAEPSPVEQLAENLMRPMVKAWLDENLPALVERVVREEIARVLRKR